MKYLLSLGLLLTPTHANAQLAWPAETWQESQNLTSLHGNFTNNLSGAHWNPDTRTLWVAVNGPGIFIALVRGEDGEYTIEQKAGKSGIWSPGGDLESLTQVDYSKDEIYVLVEGAGYIRHYDTSVYGVVKLVRQWRIRDHVPTSSGGGSEGIAFGPDEWLTKRGCTDLTGAPRVSQKGMGGLMFVAHQRGGHIYVFDCDPASTALDFVGKYATGRTESSGLELDRSNGHLYVWHNLGANYLEEVDLASTAVSGGRRLNQFREWVAPKRGNLESIALTPADAYEHEVFITDDDNQQGYGLMRYRDFAPNRGVFDASVAASSDDAEQVRKAIIELTGALELVDRGVYQKIGIRFTGVSVPPKARILRAYIQFTTADEARADLWIRAFASDDLPTFVEEKRNITSRPKTRAKVAWNPPSWSTSGVAEEAQRTTDLSSLVQEVVNRANWKPGGAMGFIITGHGRRTAASFDTDPAFAPRLHLEYETLGD